MVWFSSESGNMLKRLRNISSTRFLGLGGTLITALTILASGSIASVATLYHFTNTTDGAFPEAGLVLSSTGVLYGTTYQGGTSGWGTVFQMTPPATPGNPWTETVLYSFTGGNDGANPLGGLVIGKNNVLFGTTSQGGASGYGTAFALTPPASGGAWTLTVLHSFAGGTDGANPEAGLTLNSTTNVLYGTTYYGGSSGFGTVFSLAPAGGGAWTEKVLYSFLGGADGANPQSPLTLNSTTKVLYGTTFAGGSLGWGTIFQLVPATGGVWTESVLYTFTGGADGGGPLAGVVIGKSNVLYGTTFWGGSSTGCPVGNYPLGCGTIFQLAPPAAPGGTWTQRVLYTFAGSPTDGANPYQNLAAGAGGGLFGTTFSGGYTSFVCFGSYNGCGTAFQLKPPTTPGGAWTKVSLATFNGNNGGGPNGVILAPTGLLYGTTLVGGIRGGSGTVFLLAP